MKNIVVALLLAAGIVGISACGPKAAKEDTTSLDTASLFTDKAVIAFVKAHPKISKESVTAFSQGVDEYRNKKNIDAAYSLFMQSVASHPSARAYYELGNVCADKKEFSHAIAAYNIAEQLGYEPVSKLYYNIACAYSLQEQETESAMYLEYAIEAGYSNLKHMLTDPGLEHVRQSYMFQATYQEAMSGASDPEVTLWQSFKREFKAAVMPVILDLKTQVADARPVSFEFEKFISEMRTEKFSREVGKEFYTYATVEDNANYTALIYAIRNTIMSENAPLRFVLITFDSHGTLIDKKPIGGQLSPADPYLVCNLQPNLHFEIKQYKNTYEKNPEEHGYENNPVVKSDLTATEYYMISESGKFVQLTQQLTMR